MATSNPTRRVALYARVSTDGQTTDNQLIELRKVARRHKWKVVEEYIDNGVSGAARREKRPAFDEMCKAAVRKEFDVIAAWSVEWTFTCTSKRSTPRRQQGEHCSA